MDRSWIKVNRLSDEYKKGVRQFFEFTKRNFPNNKGFFCPKKMREYKKNVEKKKYSII